MPNDDIFDNPNTAPFVPALPPIEPEKPAAETTKGGKIKRKGRGPGKRAVASASTPARPKGQEKAGTGMGLVGFISLGASMDQLSAATLCEVLPTFEAMAPNIRAAVISALSEIYQA